MERAGFFLASEVEISVLRNSWEAEALPQRGVKLLLRGWSPGGAALVRDLWANIGLPLFHCLIPRC